MLKKFNYLVYLYAEKYAGKDLLTEERLHDEIINSILNLRGFIPESYKSYDLEAIIISKAMYYNTSIDKSLRQYYYLSKALQTIIKNKRASNAISKTIVDLKNKRLTKSMEQKTFEDDKIFFLNQDEISIKNSDKTDLLFFASQPSHFKVIDNFFELSILDNYQLVIPFRLRDQINLKNINSKKINYFEGFFSQDPQITLKNLQQEFEEIYFNNILELKNIFRFENQDFFRSQKAGIRNIFKFLLPQSLIYAISAKNLLEKKGVYGVVGVRPRRIMDRAILKMASKLNLRSNLILHSTLGSEPRELWSSGLFDNISNIFGWGEKHSTLIKSDSYFKNGNFIKAGSPLFNAPPLKKQFRNLNPRIIFAPSRNDDSVLSSLSKFNSKNPEIPITIKIRPGQETTRHLINGPFKVEPGSFGIEEILKNYDILITPYSGSHISAISEGLPVIFTPFYYEIIQDLETLYGINEDTMSFSFAKNDYQLRSILDKVIKDSDYRKDLILQQTSYFNNLVSGHTKKESVRLIEERLLSKS